ncbi:MAG: hypothetical protein NT069_14610 [Planctomycetota bacterium]|nr:hypothetical protein [Planctomycetota bacterium]
MDDPGLRFLLLMGLAGTAGYTAWRWLITPLRARLSDLDVALRIEQRYPGFRDSLASTVQFVEQGGDPRVGSPALQRAVVQQTAKRLAAVDLDDLVQTSTVMKFAIGAAVLMAVAAILVLVQPSRAALALHRLFLPFSAPAWPRAVELRLLDAEGEPLSADLAADLQVPRGEVFRFHAENTRGALPPRVMLETRPAKTNGPVTQESLRPVNVASAAGKFRELALGQIQAPKSVIEFRVIGGDDTTMAWRTLRVVNPPIVEKLQLKVTPPEYTKRPVELLPSGVGHVSALVGTVVDVEAFVNRPLATANLRLRDRERIPLQIADDRQTVTGRFRITEPGVTSWWFELRDPEGIQSSDLVRYEIRGIQDLEPETLIQAPSADLQVTATAVVPVRIVSRDDLGLAEVRLVYDVDGGAETTVPLFQGESRPEEVTSEYVFQLADLKLNPGSVVRYRSEAKDDFVHPSDGSRHLKRSVTRTLTIVSPEDKARDIEREQAGLLHDLEQVARQERQAQDQIRGLERQLEKAGEFRAEDADALKRTELLQREVNSQLSNPAVGLAHKTREILNELKDNQIEDPSSERRLEAIAGELERLGAETLPQIENSLTQARKLTEQPEGTQTPKEAERELAKAREEQSGVLESLQELQNELSEWRTERDLGQDLGSITKGQEELHRDTAELQQRLMNQGKPTPSKQDEADVARIADRQRQQAEQFRQLEEKLKEKLETAEQGEPTAATDALKETLEEAERKDVAGEMGNAASQIEQKHLGEALRSQQDVLKKMKELAGTLEQKREQDEATLVKKMKESGEAAASIADRQRDLQSQLAEAGAMPTGAEREEKLDRLRQEQRKLREETARLARLLQRSGAQRSGDAVQRAGGSMNQAEDEIADSDLENADRKMGEAIDDIEQAEQELSDELKEAEERLADELLQKMAAELKSLVGRQQAALEESRRLDGLHEVSGKWSRAQNQSLKQLSEVQRTLRQETESLADRLAPAKVFSLSLRGAARAMQKAAELIAKKEVAKPTQQLQESARRRFEELVEAIAARNQDEQQPQGKPPEDGQQQQQKESNGGPQGDTVSAIAQLKILVTLQREVIERTAELDALRSQPGHEWSDADRDELEQLRIEQDQLADFARELAEMVAAPTNDDEEDQSGDLPDPNKRPTDEGEPGFLPKDGDKPGPQNGPNSPERKVEDLPDVD